MPKAPKEVAGFLVLPILLKTSAKMQDAKHYIYVRSHEPRIPDEDTARSLFLVNVPVTTTESHLKHLFSTQLNAGRVERIEFSKDSAVQPSALVGSSKTSKKRKRQTAEEIEASLERYHLPPTYPSSIHSCGSAAVVVFVDRPSLESSLKAVRRAAKSSTVLIWGEGLEARSPLTGTARYKAHLALQYPSQTDLLSIVDSYMTVYSSLESARSAENNRKSSAPDEDGFVTVTRGTKGGVLKQDEAEEMRAKQKAKEKGLDDFYRFQMRERRKEQQGQLLKQFEDDKRRVEEMRTRRKSLKHGG